MKRIYRNPPLLLSLFLCSTCWGQNDTTAKSSATPAKPAAQVQAPDAGEGFVSMTRRENSSRIDPQKEELVLKLSSDITTTTVLPEIQLQSCQAKASLGYQQRNTLARVTIKISHEQCQTASGTVDIVVRYRTDAGEQATLRTTEPWELEDTTQLEFSRDYEIGGQATLSQVLSRNVRCTCNDVAQ